MLHWRLTLGTLMIAALVGLCWLDHFATIPGTWLFPVAVAASLMATTEFLDLAARAQLHPLRWAVYWGNLLLVVSSWVAMFEQCWLKGFLPELGLAAYAWESALLLALGVAVLLVLFGELARYEKPGGNLANMAVGIFAIVYIGLMLCLAVQLRIVWGVGALASWIIVVKSGDIGAYTVGRLIGRHKMAPKISPGKTVEGAVGALAFSCLGAWLTFDQLLPKCDCVANWVEPGRWYGWIAFGLLVGAAGMAGDLVESLLKRDVGAKDSSVWLPGFGGVLDILDSLLLAAPVAWFCWASGLVGR
jgi:phosphatidate cytidylyltransferase